jgi:hypothetical protein
MKAATVADLIKFLQFQNQDALIGFALFSEQCLMDLDEIVVIEACKPREDGWIQNKRPDMEAQAYLIFPGN